MPWRAIRYGFFAHSPAPIKPDFTLLGMIKTIDDIQHGRLAGTVGSDDGANLAALDIETDVAECRNAAKGEGDVFHLQYRVVVDA